MDFSAGSLFASLLMSTVGLGFCIYGRKQRRAPQILAGIALMVYPYFVASPLWILAIGTAVIIALWAAVRAGL